MTRPIHTGSVTQGQRQAKDAEDSEGEHEDNGEDGKRKDNDEVNDEEEHEEE